MSRLGFIAAVLAGALPPLAVPARAAPPEAVCAEVDAEVLSPTRWLRALSLDLRGVVPSPAELLAVAEAAEPDAEVAAAIEQWLHSDAFTERAVRFHRALLWPNLDPVNLHRAGSSLRQDGGIFWRLGAATSFRGGAVQCLDAPAEFDASGGIVRWPQPDGTLREGWVWVSPYWAPETSIRVCAFDAQGSLLSPQGVACNTNAGQTQTGCGCGPGLAWCRFGNTHRRVADAFVRDLELRIARVIGEGRSYLDLFTDRAAFVNGPIAHYYRWQAGVHGGVRMLPLPVPAHAVPDLAHTEQDTWVEIELPASHAGILSSPAFLLRFQTNRGRANQFYNSFLCQPFQPPDTGLDASDDEQAMQTDLQQRDGCKWCHTTLEPAAAYWGRWTEVGAGYLDPAAFPPLRADCVQCASTSAPCSDECNRYYLTSPLAAEELDYLGHLHAYVFRHPLHHPHVEQGPSALAMKSVVSNQLPRCLARSVAEWLLRRPLDALEEGRVDELAVAFAASGFDFRALVREVVAGEAYRRVR